MGFGGLLFSDPLLMGKMGTFFIGNHGQMVDFHGFSVSLFDFRRVAIVVRNTICGYSSCVACIETPSKKKPLAKPHPLRTAEIGMYEVTCQLGRSNLL